MLANACHAIAPCPVRKKTHTETNQTKQNKSSLNFYSVLNSVQALYLREALRHRLCYHNLPASKASGASVATALLPA